MLEDKLIKNYEAMSKHSNYQTLSTQQKTLFNEDKLNINSRYESERLAYFDQKIDFKNKSVVDVGSNTGFFSFEILNLGAHDVTAIEGNKEHADFITICCEGLKEDRISVINEYYDFKSSKYSKKDIALILNVMHHVGDDYESSKIENVEDAKNEIVDSLCNLATVYNELIFQLGFNWCGDINKPLFANGTKKEMIDFISQNIKDFWDISEIGICERTDDNVLKFCDLNAKNIERDDSLGEFLNRPIFILKSKVNNA